MSTVYREIFAYWTITNISQKQFSESVIEARGHAGMATTIIFPKRKEYMYIMKFAKI